jgi:phenylacetate-CoA ligase
MQLSSSLQPARVHIENQQLLRLRELITALVPGNRFYTAKLRDAGLDASIASLEEFSKRLPLTSKQQLIDDQALHPPYGSNLTYPIERYSRFSQTSGTSGMPMRWLDTAESWDWMVQNWERVYQAAGVTRDDRIFFAFSFGPFLGFWVAFDCAARIGCLALPGGGLRSAARLASIIDNEVTVLCCTPTYAIRLAETAAEEGIDLSAAKVRRVIVAGEAGGSIPGTRDHIERLWHGARVVDHHGMTETGPVSYGCPVRPGVLHIIESAYIAEVIDRETGEAVPAGGSGELVLTNLGRTGSPLLRYRTGDLVKRAEADLCECGTHDVALEGGILTRTDDMIVVRGVNIYPSAVEDILRKFSVTEYQVGIRTLHAMPELSVQVEGAPGQTADLTHRLEAAFRGAFALRIAVSIVPTGSLPRFEMKAKRWVRMGQ